jgi:hypothetical protein
MLAGAMLGAPAILMAASFGGFGMKMDQASKTELFHLVPPAASR